MHVWLRYSRRNVEPSWIGWRSMTITGRGPLVDSLNPPRCFECSNLLRLLQAFWYQLSYWSLFTLQAHHLQRNDYQYDRPYTAVRDGDFLQAGWPDQCSSIYTFCVNGRNQPMRLLTARCRKSIKDIKVSNLEVTTRWIAWCKLTISFMYWPVQVLNEREKELIDLKCRALRILLCWEMFRLLVFKQDNAFKKTVRWLAMIN